MAMYFCKLCGGILAGSEESAVYTCTGCGAQQTLPQSPAQAELGIHDIMIKSIQDNDILSVHNDLTHGVSANATTRIGRGKFAYESSALHEAISTAKNVEIVSLLLEYGADPHEIVHLPGEDRPLLSCAVLDAADADIAFLLLEAGADANCVRVVHTDRGDRYFTPLQDAITHLDSKEIIHLLHNFGACDCL